ncbi:MAG TPA: carbohydrate kinase family protein [Ignavibacteriaceae bacterium]|nr:carbohydrate kinase family protein [Ignavibacteriaceae bacterium]
MNFLVLGQSLEDHIIYRGNTTVKPGGIFYSVLGLKSIIDENDRILLCSLISEKDMSLFSPVYDDIDKSLFSYVDEIPKVYLNISDKGERGECYSLVNQNLSLDKITDFNIYDGILINMITGFDITLDQIKLIRSKFKRDIFFDVHTLARGMAKDGTRNFRVIPDFEKWAENIDILQVNETEFSFLFELKSEKEIIEKLFSLGVKILVITNGEIGARVYYRKEDEIVSSFVTSKKMVVKNNVGCGDIFGAVFFYSYICENDIGNALRLANNAAGFAVAYENLENSEGFRNDVTAGLD